MKILPRCVTRTPDPTRSLAGYDGSKSENVYDTTFYEDFGDLKRRRVRFELRIRSALASKKAPISLRRWRTFAGISRFSFLARDTA